MFIERGAKKELVSLLMDSMTNASNRYWSNSLDDWVVVPDWKLRSSIALSILYFLEGRPMTRNETVKLVGVVQQQQSAGDGAATISDLNLRERVTGLLADAKAARPPSPRQKAQRTAPATPAAKDGTLDVEPNPLEPGGDEPDELGEIDV